VATVDDIKITILVDNQALGGLASEHGLSLWVEGGRRHILLDTGQGGALEKNVAALGVDLSRTDMLVISHGHYDHTGGLPYVYESFGCENLFVHPDAVRNRYKKNDAPPHRAIGMPENAKEVVNRLVKQRTWTTIPTRVADGVYVTGPVPRCTDFEDVGGAFFRDPECLAPDPIPDDQALWLDVADGIVIVLGCSHSGVVNTLDYIARLTGNKPIRAVIGGMHLLNANENRIEKTLEAFKRHNPDFVAPSHCTGETAVAVLQEGLGDRCRPCMAGTRFTFPGAS